MFKTVYQKLFSRSFRRNFKRAIIDLKALPFHRDLNKLGKIYQTDKVGEHFYTQHYMHHFRKFKYKKFNFLEIGVGGYDKPLSGGKSLRMWKRYFPFAKIFSFDIFDKSQLQEKRIRILQGSQIDNQFLDQVMQEMGSVDIIVDDGSHLNHHVIHTFEYLFPKLNDGGIYAIEDVQTSYWPDHGGDSHDLTKTTSMVAYFKALADGLNHKEFIRPGYQPTYFDQKIISIHFYHNLIFIYKGNNDEPSNIISNNEFKIAK